MEKITFEKWDPAEEIETKEDVIAELELALEENDPALLLAVLGDIARSKGLVELAEELNLDAESLQQAFSAAGNLAFIPILKALGEIGFRFSFTLPQNASKFK